ncbi:hemolysin III family protein, partial [Lutimaribacter sp. EGI FJ00014]|nr:hemolysin III family protein [Lutimaribacter sp. EGI FJ00014]
MDGFSWNYGRAEIIADGTIHVTGIIFAVCGAITMILVAFMLADATDAVAASIYALTLPTTLLMSGIYNMWPVGPRKWRLRKYDHAAIYLLIAGTYTPFATQMGPQGTWLLAFIWSVAGLGMFLKIVFPGRYDRFAILLYLGLGWAGAAMYDTMMISLTPVVVWLIVAGGIVYSTG